MPWPGRCSEIALMTSGRITPSADARIKRPPSNFRGPGRVTGIPAVIFPLLRLGIVARQDYFRMGDHSAMWNKAPARPSGSYCRRAER
jgi:hypothetical protein